MINSTLFAVHWLFSESDAFLGQYSNLIKSIVDYIRIVSDLYPTHTFSICINGQVLIKNENFRNYQTLLATFGSFRIPTSAGTLEQSIFPILSVVGSRLILISNDAKFDWNQLRFDLEFFQLKSQEKVQFPLEVFVIETKVENPNDLEYFVVQGTRPCCHGIQCASDSIGDVMKKASILLNDLSLVRVANIPMKKRTDSEKKVYDVLLVIKRDGHIIGPCADELFTKGWDFFFQNRQFLLAWAKKSSPRFSTKKCVHLCTPMDLSDAPTVVVLETVKSGKDEFMLSSSSTELPTHTLSFQNNSLFFNCLHYLEEYLEVAKASGKVCPIQHIPQYSHDLDPLKTWEMNAFSEMLQNSGNPGVVSGISEGIRMLTSPSFLASIKLEQKFLFELKDMLVKVLNLKINEKSQLKALSSLIEYAKNETPGPIFNKSIPADELFLQYLELFDQLLAFYLLTKHISNAHLILANEFGAKITQFRGELATKKTKSIGYLMLQSAAQ